MKVLLVAITNLLGGGFAHPDTLIPIFLERAIGVLEDNGENITIWACGCWMLSWVSTIYPLDDDIQHRIGPRVIEIVFQEILGQAGYYAGWLTVTALMPTLKELTAELSEEQEQVIDKSLNDLDPYRIRSDLGIAAIAAVHTERFSREKILSFCEAHGRTDKRWQLIMNIAAH